MPSMANCSILLIMPRSPFVWLLTTNPWTGKNVIVSISIIIHYLILRTVNILVIIIINNNLTDDDDIARPKRCLYAQANVLARKFCLCNISTKFILFQAYCALMYTSSLWSKLKKYSLKSITVAYNNSLRILLNLPSRCSASFMFATNYIKFFNERIRSSIFRLLCRLHQSDNILFINYLHTDIHFKSRMYSYWRSLLYT